MDRAKMTAASPKRAKAGKQMGGAKRSPKRVP